MKEIILLIPALIRLITPDPQFKGIRLEKKELKMAKKKLRIAEKMYKQIYKEFKKDGFDADETKQLLDLRDKIVNRKIELI